MLYLPWPGYNERAGPNYVVPDRFEFAACIDLASRLGTAARAEPGACMEGTS